MTDTPDALKTNEAMRRRCRELTRVGCVDDYDRVVDMVLDDFDTVAKQRDDAIKRLADVEQKKQTLLDGMKLQDAVLIDAGMVLDEYEWRNARAEKSEADLAAARAEVERLQSSINVALDRYEADDKHGCWKTLMQNCGAALAPKETNNG